eukprot:gene3180-3925_t
MNEGQGSPRLRKLFANKQLYSHGTHYLVRNDLPYPVPSLSNTSRYVEYLERSTVRVEDIMYEDLTYRQATEAISENVPYSEGVKYTTCET